MAGHGTRLPTAALNRVFLDSLGNAVLWQSGPDSKPLELDLGRPAPCKLRVYLYNATYPPGGRTLGERKIQLIVPHQPRGARGNLDHSGGRLVVLVGYEADADVFILWDAGSYRDFPYSMNVQVNAETIFAAYSGRIERQHRHRRTPATVSETVVCAPSARLREAIAERIALSFARLMGEAA